MVPWPALNWTATLLLSFRFFSLQNVDTHMDTNIPRIYTETRQSARNCQALRGGSRLGTLRLRQAISGPYSTTVCRDPCLVFGFKVLDECIHRRVIEPAVEGVTTGPVEG